MSSVSRKNSGEQPLIGHFINGQRVLDSGNSLPVYNPATGQIIRQVVLAEPSTVEDAITAAEKAFPEWRNTTPLSRARVMFRFKELIEKNAETIVSLITEEHGKVLDDARGELQRGIVLLEILVLSTLLTTMVEVFLVPVMMGTKQVRAMASSLRV